MAYSLTTTRLTGLSSGMDTDSIIQNMMKLEQLKVDREVRSRTTLEWKQEALKGVTSDLKSFRETYMSVLSPDNMLSQSTYRKYNVTTTDTSNAISITAKSTAETGNIRINSIDQLATNTVAKSGYVKYDENGENPEFVTTKASAAGSDEIAANNNVKLFDLKLANKMQFDENGKISFAINGVKFEFDANDTLNDMLSTVSKNEKAGVNFTYSRLTDTFSITAKESGEKGEVNIGNIAGNMFGENSATGITGTIQGQNAILYVNGERVEKSSNEFEADGIVYDLKAETDKPMDFKVTQDVDGAMAQIKKFVEGYNTMIGKLESMLAETKTKKEKGYTPLTEEEKSAMTKEQIDEWEAIAKKGILKNDQGIQTMLDQLRNALYTKVDGVGLSPADLGLRTGTWQDGGKISLDSLDDNTLRSMLEKDVDAVMAVFTNKSESSDKAVAASENGLLYRMTSIFDTYTKGSQAITLNSIDRSLTQLNKKIDDMEDKMVELEEKYYLKFAAMETALSEMQSQSNWISSMLGGNS